jgi:hypothetical protein
MDVLLMNVLLMNVLVINVLLNISVLGQRLNVRAASLSPQVLMHWLP